MTLRGADPSVVRHALASGEPLPGTRGFAGRLSEGRLVRDVLGRVPLYSDADDPTAWSFSPHELDVPELVPAGSVRTADGDRRVWELPDPPLVEDRQTAVTQVRDAVRNSVGSTTTDGLAVAFSGGVDSAVVAALCDQPAYVVGFPESHDLAAARSAARAMDIDLRVVELTREDLRGAVPRVARAIDRTNAMDVEIALPLFFAASRAHEDGFDRLAMGQGADELFGGYAKVANAPDDARLDADTVREARREVVETLPNQLPRDVLAVRAGGVDPVAPLLDDRVVRAALELPAELLVTARGERKWALRLAARTWVPDRVAFREKKAVQYGSLVARELDRLARESGFKRRLGDHVTKYVQSRL
jgi:asparagine synthase (glutamine-hydrolysing)